MLVLSETDNIVTHSDLILRPDPARQLVRPFVPGDPEDYCDPTHPRPQRIADRVLALPESVVCNDLERLMQVSGSPRSNVEAYLLNRFEEVNGSVIERCSVSKERGQLIAAYFCAEYAFEAAALFNPSMIPDPLDVALSGGGVRFLMSLRSVGEGHVSSVTFRTGTWHPDHGFQIEVPKNRGIMLRLSETDRDDDSITQLVSADDCALSEAVIFPTTPSQRQGIEDMRLVLFTGDDGRSEVFGTYTAFDGQNARPELMHSVDLKSFSLFPLSGRYATGKGMALFPRKVGGRYLMLSRQDQENIWLLASDDVHEWNEGRKLVAPAEPWEFVQLGNCGSPMEIDEGWLVITHGVGVVRSYAMGACLLDKDDPSKIIAQMREPLFRPMPEGASDGYVPNVVYSCGGFVHDRTLLLPYAVADSITRFASVRVDDLLGAMN